MGGYLVNFAVYTMAMIGLIFFALMMYKKFAIGGDCSKKSGFLGVEESISIAPRKNLYVVRAGNERFLIAGDVDKTTLISKLDDGFEHRIDNQPRRESPVSAASIDDLPVISAFPKKGNNVLHNMVRKINN
ncbi:TPA: FliO/MopB family protein [Candidatus Scatousia excrementigallinarum]|uniref:FliO/MopB family protein n=1 Tax=Candidatus Scatousia excrementigallinarum TaxID=2840935 RepID=A0A9D1EYG6_9BACT|nr:FliO/MopB family protein [Candidatus Scatousia excrementigallinarum]